MTLERQLRAVFPLPECARFLGCSMVAGDLQVLSERGVNESAGISRTPSCSGPT
jgi:hypothetical protein